MAGGSFGTMEPAGQRIAHDAIVDLRVDRILIQADAGAACSAALNGFTKALNHVGFSRTRLVLQSDQKSARMRRVVAVVLRRTKCSHRPLRSAQPPCARA